MRELPKIVIEEKEIKDKFLVKEYLKLSLLKRIWWYALKIQEKQLKNTINNKGNQEVSVTLKIL